MIDTKEKILDISLQLFSQKGYSAVSIRDICKIVEIKESSVYYHFKNKQAIFDELLLRFQRIAESMMQQLETSLTDSNISLSGNFYSNMCESFFENYLMDDFCNKIMRLLLIEQQNNEQAQSLYKKWLFDEPLKFQNKIFAMLTQFGIVTDGNSQYLAIKYYSPIFMYSQRWLFSGTLTEEKKNIFRKNAYEHIQMFFTELGGQNG